VETDYLVMGADADGEPGGKRRKITTSAAANLAPHALCCRKRDGSKATDEEEREILVFIFVFFVFLLVVVRLARDFSS